MAFIKSIFRSIYVFCIVMFMALFLLILITVIQLLNALIEMYYFQTDFGSVVGLYNCSFALNALWQILLWEGKTCRNYNNLM